MANEIRVQTSLQIRKGSQVYQSQPTSFNADMAGSRGPTPGAILISRNGTDVDLSQLTALGGLCRLMNLDDTNWVEYGVYEPATFRFYPLGEILPGESYVIRLSRWLGYEVGTGVGTGSIGGSNTFRLKANAAACVVLVEAFDA